MLRMALQDAIGSFDPLVKLLSLHGMVGVFSRDETGASVIAYEHSIGFDLSIDRSIDRSIHRSITGTDVRRTVFGLAKTTSSHAWGGTAPGQAPAAIEVA